MAKVLVEDFSKASLNSMTKSEWSYVHNNYIDLLKRSELDPKNHDKYEKSGKMFGNNLANLIYNNSAAYCRIRIEVPAYNYAIKELKISKGCLLDMADNNRTAGVAHVWNMYRSNKHKERLYTFDHNSSVSFIINATLESWAKYHSEPRIDAILLGQTIDIISEEHDLLLYKLKIDGKNNFQSYGTRSEREMVLGNNKLYVLRKGLKD